MNDTPTPPAEATDGRLPARTCSRSSCEDCGTELIDNCPQCGAPQCCPKCCDDATFELGVRRAVTQGLKDSYSCGRVWEAWQFGTMTQDDFAPAWEDEQIIWDIVGPILGMVATRIKALKSSENDLGLAAARSGPNELDGLSPSPAPPC